MGLKELFLIAIGLSMDAFAVSICKGLSVKKILIRHMFCVGIWFGGFQALMPFVGYTLGSYFQSFITSIDHWIAFILLGFIGFNMIRESRSEEEECSVSFGIRAMSALAIATSIDALAVGITFAFLQVSIIPAITLIGVTTFVLSVIGLFAGNLFGNRFKSHSELLGGVILILMGFKILVEHLGIL